VTDQYLAQLRAPVETDIARLAEFISVGARLLLLKSRALLPRDDVEDEDTEDAGDDVSALITALREYRRFKQAAEFLRERDGGHATYRREVPPPDVPLPTGLDTVTLNSLVGMIRDVLARMPEEEPVPEIAREPVRMRDRIASIVNTLERDGRTSFRRMIELATSRTMIIVDFMAILELIKQRYLEARQSESFGDIDLVRRTEVATPSLDEIVEDLDEGAGSA
jgi:segregation and condensation protein A